jgi:hypothetical protein
MLSMPGAQWDVEVAVKDKDGRDEGDKAAIHLQITCILRGHRQQCPVRWFFMVLCLLEIWYSNIAT